MPNHGYCKKCWWYKGGICYIQGVRTQDDFYCPDYASRNKLNKKGMLDNLLKEWKEKGYTTVDIRRDKLARFSRAEQARQFARIFEQYS